MNFTGRIRKFFRETGRFFFKMKELWFFMIHLFEGAEKAAKKIKKAEKRHVYEECIERLFSDYPLNQKLVK